jgi:CBS domain-containing protein
MRALVLGPTSELRDTVDPAITVDARATVRDVARQMRAANVSAVLVEPGGRFATERDLTRALAAGLGADDSIDGVTTDPLRVRPDMAVVDAAAFMLNHQIRHLVVEGDGRVGVVSLRTVMAVLLQAVTPDVWLERLRMAIRVRPEMWIG